MTDDALIDAAREAAMKAYAPYSRYQVGAALLFADDTIVTGANIENASYGLTLCAETVAVAGAMAAGRRGGLITVAVIGRGDQRNGVPITPCGRCRQVLSELAQLGGTDPDVLCVGDGRTERRKLSSLLPMAFGPAYLD